MSGYFQEVTESVGRGWNRFWYAPSDPLPCAVLRIVVGLLVIGHLLMLMPGLDRWHSSAGLLSPQVVTAAIAADGGRAAWHPSYFAHLGPLESRVAHGLAIAAAAAFAAGLFSRVMGLITLAALLSCFHRLPLVAGQAEPVLIFLVAYLCIGPAGARLSVSRWLARRQSPLEEAPVRPSYWATLSLRMIQVHLAAFVAMMGLTKLNGDAWWQGEAIWNLLAQTHSRPLDLAWMRNYELLVNFWTHAVVFFELAFPVLIWHRLARPILLVLGTLLWLSIIAATGLLLFGMTMIAATLAFVPAEAYHGLLAARSGASTPATTIAAR